MLLQINRSYLKLVKGDNFPRYCFQRWFGADYSHTETPTTKCFISCSHFIFIHGIQLLPGTIFSLFFHTHPHQKHTVERSKFWVEQETEGLLFLYSKFKFQWILAEDGCWFNMGFKDYIVFFLAKFMFLENSLCLKPQRSILGYFPPTKRYNFYVASFLGLSTEELFDC